MSPTIHALVSGAAQPDTARQLAQTLGCCDLPSAMEHLASLHELGIADELLTNCLLQLARILPTSPNPDRGLANLTRYIHASRSPQALLALFERDEAALPILLRILATSQSWAEQLITDPESFDLLRLTEGLPVSRGILVDELATEIGDSFDPVLVARTLHTQKQREMMRIAFGDFIGALTLETVTQQLSVLAEAILETATTAALKESYARIGIPLTADGQVARFAILAFGKLGGNELSYAPNLRLMFICDSVQGIQGAQRGASSVDYFERVAKRVLQLVSEDSQIGPARYEVNTELRPGGTRGSLTSTVEAAVRFYENNGQTWERQAFIKARHVAGDQSLSEELLLKLEPWIFRRDLHRADISELISLKRQLEKRVLDQGQNLNSVNDQPGGVRDIEFLIQFLQLLNGGELEEVRSGNTLEAIGALERVGCLTAQERSVLDDNYRYLRRLQHHLQIIFDTDVDVLPTTDANLRQFLLAFGYEKSAGVPDEAKLLEEFRERTTRNSRIVNHLLDEAFSVEASNVTAESDLILESSPAIEDVDRLLKQYGFQSPLAAYQELVALGQEKVSFLSSRRCRYFLSAIAARLLLSVSQTPSPDQTLANLGRVSDSLGGKAVLWELFQSSQASLDLCVRLCACSPYLIGILTSNPGMIDELIDSLMLDRLPGTQQIESLLTELCRGVEEPGLVLHSFKNSMHLHIGVRDVLGKDAIVDTHRALSDVAESCLKQVIEHEYHRLIQKLGVPMIAQGERAGEVAELIVLAVGKLGGREPNYHSDLDVLFVFEGEGSTRGLLPHRRHDPIPNRVFFNQLGQRVVKSIMRVGPSGHLYELDARLRPLGGTVGAAVSLDDLQNYFCHGPAQLWERQGLCKARAVWASPNILPKLAESLRTMMTSLEWRPEYAADIQRHRYRLEQGAAGTNIKRGWGGTLDIEFIVQMLQLKHARQAPDVLVPGTLEALVRLQHVGAISSEHSATLSENYRWLRRVESGLRLMNLPARHELPSSLDELNQLQFLLRSEANGAPSRYMDASEHPLMQKCMTVRKTNRDIFTALFR